MALNEQLLQYYRVLFLKKLDAWAERNPDDALKSLGENEWRDIINLVCEEIRVQTGMGRELHEELRKRMMDHMFKAHKKVWVVKK